MKKISGQTDPSILRQKAEELLKARPFKTGTEFSESVTQKLIHELEVHQIELEMQNEELARAKELAAQIATENYAELYDFAPSGYFTLSPEGEILRLNLCGSQILGKERSNLLHSRLGFFVSDSTKPVFNHFLEKIFTSKTKEFCEIWLETKNNLPVFVYLTGIVADLGEQCLITMVDITGRKLAENELIKAKEKAEESDRLKTTFLQNVSHEIRSPMKAIMGFSELLTENYNNKENIEKFSGIIKQRCTDLLDIVNDILDISKIESGQLLLNIEECSITELFTELSTFYNEYRQRIGKEHVQFELLNRCTPSEDIVFTDKVKLKQIFINLLSNAFKFTIEGKIEGGCRIDSDKNLFFYVSDTGIGIPAEKQKVIFERFAQLSQTKIKNGGGTGLGLSIVKGLVNLLGSEINLESEPGKGSTFSFTIKRIK